MILKVNAKKNNSIFECGWREAQKRGRAPFSFEPAFLAWEAKVLDQSVQ